MDMLTFAKLIDHRALLTTIFINQSFFHAACAYSRDMLRGQMRAKLPYRKIFHRLLSLYLVEHHHLWSSNSTGPQGHTRHLMQRPSRCTASSHCLRRPSTTLREAIKDQARVYAGSEWVDAVLHQRETGLRDVGLNVISKSTSAFARAHDLREPGGSESASQKVCQSRQNKVALLKVFHLNKIPVRTVTRRARPIESFA